MHFISHVGTHRRFVWASELEKLLDELSVHPDADIARRALDVVTFKWVAVETGDVTYDDPNTARHNSLREQMHGKKKKNEKKGEGSGDRSKPS